MSVIEKKFYNIVILIVSSETNNKNTLYDNFVKIWESIHSRVKNDVKILFLHGDENLDCEYKVVDDNFYYKVKEDKFTGMFTKTIQGMKYIYNNFEFNYIIRTNLSSIIDIPKTISILENQPKEEFIGGYYIGPWMGSPSEFFTGGFFILSKDVVKYTIDNKHIGEEFHKRNPTRFWEDIILNTIFYKKYLSKSVKFNENGIWDFTRKSYDLRHVDVITNQLEQRKKKNDIIFYRIFNTGDRNTDLFIQNYVANKMFNFVPDRINVDLIDKDNYIINNCRFCDSWCSLYTVLDLGSVPLAGSFPVEKDLEKEQCYPLSLILCSCCNLVQVNTYIKPDILFEDYRYISSVSLSKYFEEESILLKNKFKLTKNSSIVEIGCNDGILLKYLSDLDIKNVKGFEPSHNISKLAEKRGLNIICDYFSDDTVLNYIKPKSVDLIITTNSFAHINNISSVIKGIKKILKDKGKLFIEVHYLKSLIEDFQYDNIYHEHIFNYSLTSLSIMFLRYGMTIIEFEPIKIHCGSMRVTIINEYKPYDSNIRKILDNEFKLGLNSPTVLKNFWKKIDGHKNNVKEVLQGLQKQGKNIVGYGASGRCVMLCNICKIDTSLIKYIVDESPERAGRYIPKMNIPIYEKSKFDLDGEIDYIFIFAWNYSKMIIEKIQKNNIHKDVKYIIPFPELQIVSKYEDIDNKRGL